MWPPWPVYGAADLVLLTPTASLIQCATSNAPSRLLQFLVAVHTVAFGFSLVSFLVGYTTMALLGLMATAIVGIATTLYYYSSTTQTTMFATMASPLMYALALPLWKYRPGAAVVVVVINVVTFGGIILMMVASDLHRAWGCYAPGTPISEFVAGMCKLPTTEMGPRGAHFGYICNNAVPNCYGAITPFVFFGKVFHFVIQAQTIGLIVWFVLLWRTILSASHHTPQRQPAAATSNDTSKAKFM